MNNQNDIASFLKMNARRRSPLETMQYVSPQDPNQMPSYAPAMPQQAAPQGDGTGAGDMDPSFIRAVQREMQGEQAPQGLPPVRGVQSDIAAGVEAASGFAYGGAVRGYQVGGKVGDDAKLARLRRLSEVTGIKDPKLLEEKLAELEGNANPGFFNRAMTSLGRSRVKPSSAYSATLPSVSTGPETPPTVDEQITGLETAQQAQVQAQQARINEARPFLMAAEGQRPVNVINSDELNFPGQPVEPAAVVPGPVVPRPPAPQRAADAAAAAAAAAEKPPATDAARDTSQKPVDDGGYAERMKKLLDDDEGDMTPRERSMALIQAGAAMMAAASKPGATFLGSAGEGLTKGLEGFNETRSNRAVKRMKQAAMLQAERQAGIENTRGDRALELQEQGNRLARDQYNTNKDPNSPENKYRSAATKALTKPSNFAERNAESKRISALPPGPEKDAATNAFNMATGIINQQTLTSRQNAKLVEVSLKAGAAFDKSLDAMTGTPAEIKAKRNAAVMAAVQEAKGLLGLSDDTGNGDIDSEDSLPE